MRRRKKLCGAAALALGAALLFSMPSLADQGVSVGTAPAAGAAEAAESTSGASAGTAASTGSSSSSGSISSGTSQTASSGSGQAVIGMEPTAAAQSAETSGAAASSGTTASTGTAASTGIAPSSGAAASSDTTTSSGEAASSGTTTSSGTAVLSENTAPTSAASDTVETAAVPTSAAVTETTATAGSADGVISSDAKRPEDALQDSGLSDEEMAALDIVTGPGVGMVKEGDNHGVNEPTITAPDSGGAVATDWSQVSDQRKQIVSFAESLVGSQYKFGGDDPEEGFDCSGFVMYVMKNTVGIELYHQSAVQATSGVSVTASEMRPGDIIAYDGIPQDGYVNHVAIYVGDGKAAHAVGTGKGVQVTNWNYANPLTIRNVLGD